MKGFDILPDRMKAMYVKLEDWLSPKWMSFRKWWHARSRIWKLFILALVSFMIAALGLLILFLTVLTGRWGHIPDRAELDKISNPVSSVIFARNGEVVGRCYTENRSFVDSMNINEHFLHALVAVEDHRYFQHHGIDYYSLGRVLVKSLLFQNESSGGGSTLTQQLVKNLFPRIPIRLLGLPVNKMREMIIASRLESVYNKNELLWLYASTVSFGEQTFGLQTAAQRFFSKDQSELKLEEAALLAGLLKATRTYSPRLFPERALSRRNLVLDLMARHGHIEPQVADSIKQIPLVLDYKSTLQSARDGRYFKQYIIREFKDIADTLVKPDGKSYDIYRDGLKIYTSLDYELQSQASEVQASHMKWLQRTFEDAWGSGSMFGYRNKIVDDHILKHPVYRSLRNRGLSAQEAIDSFNQVSKQTLWSWDGWQEKEVTRIDSIKHYLKLLHSAVFGVDPYTGGIRVYIGGNDYGRFQYDNIMAKRQPGSLFKPFVYLAALESGVSPCDYYPNRLHSYPDYDDWTPANADDRYGGYMAVSEALAHSVNTVSVQLVFEAGIKESVQMAQRLGVASKVESVPSVVLGTSDVSLYEMVGAYASLVNRKYRVRPHAILRIEDQNGKLIYERDSIYTAERLDIESGKIDTLLSMMYKVSRKGTARALYSRYGIPDIVYAKTGTTQNQSEGWFIAGTQDLVIGSWVGHEDRRIHFPTLGSGSASRTALPLVGPVLKKAYLSHASRPVRRPVLFDCPGTLDSLLYPVYKQKLRQDSLDRTEPNFGGWLKRIFGRKRKRLSDNYYDRILERQLEEIETMHRIENEDEQQFIDQLLMNRPVVSD